VYCFFKFSTFGRKFATQIVKNDSKTATSGDKQL